MILNDFDWQVITDEFFEANDTFNALFVMTVLQKSDQNSRQTSRCTWTCPVSCVITTWFHGEKAVIVRWQQLVINEAAKPFVSLSDIFGKFRSGWLCISQLELCLKLSGFDDFCRIVSSRTRVETRVRCSFEAMRNWHCRFESTSSETEGRKVDTRRRGRLRFRLRTCTRGKISAESENSTTQSAAKSHEIKWACSCVVENVYCHTMCCIIK